MVKRLIGGKKTKKREIAAEHDIEISNNLKVNKNSLKCLKLPIYFRKLWWTNWWENVRFFFEDSI